MALYDIAPQVIKDSDEVLVDHSCNCCIVSTKASERHNAKAVEESLLLCTSHFLSQLIPESFHPLVFVQESHMHTPTTATVDDLQLGNMLELPHKNTFHMYTQFFHNVLRAKSPLREQDDQQTTMCGTFVCSPSVHNHGTPCLIVVTCIDGSLQGTPFGRSPTKGELKHINTTYKNIGELKIATHMPFYQTDPFSQPHVFLKTSSLGRVMVSNVRAIVTMLAFLLLQKDEDEMKHLHQLESNFIQHLRPCIGVPLKGIIVAMQENKKSSKSPTPSMPRAE